MATFTREILLIFANCLSGVETGGQIYGNGEWDDITLQYTNSDIEHAITIGAFARLGVEAKAMLMRIRKEHPDVFEKYDTASIGADLDASDWSKYQLPSKTCAKAKAIATIISRPESILVQKEMVGEDVQKKADIFEKRYGVHRIDALLHLVNIAHLGGGSENGPLKRIMGRIEGEVTLEKIRDSLLQDSVRNQVGAEPYKRRQALMYKWLHEKVTPLLNSKGLVEATSGDAMKGDEITMISNCGHDENGRYRGGKAGDQTGGEWEIINWYNRPWLCVLVHPNQKVMEKIAELATQAARNNLVGYDQDQRYTFWEHLKASNYYPSQITIACEADCSSGVAAIIKAVGYLLGEEKLQKVSIYLYTGNMRAALKAAGFTVLFESKYLSGSAYLPIGAVLLNDNHHVAVNITKGTYATGSASTGSSTTSTPKGYLSKGDSGTAVKTMQQMLIACGYSCGNAGADGDFGNGTDAGLRAFQKDHGLEVDGCYGPASKAKLTELNGMKTGDSWIKSLQKAIGAGVDGVAGPETLGKCPLLKKGKSGTVVKLLQQKIISLGFSCGSYGADGSFGPATDSAVRAYQKACGLGVDGCVGPNTWKKLLGL